MQKNILFIILCIAVVSPSCAVQPPTAAQGTKLDSPGQSDIEQVALPDKRLTIDINDLCVHDPFVLAEPDTKTYIVYQGYSPRRYISARLSINAGVIAYTSKDLIKWERPRLVFEIPEGFWADRNAGPWAPEVHKYKDKYYLFATFHDWGVADANSWGGRKIKKRGTQICVSENPLGPFKPIGNKPHTPEGEITLDGTLWVEDGRPWLIYCHEWVQITDGLIKAIRLKDDLSGTIGEPITLLNAADFDWTDKEPGSVTDGPQFYQMKNGTLAMLWSSHSSGHLYAQTVAYSPSGKLAGPWNHPAKPLLWDDRGHGMLIKDFDGRLLLVLHRYFRMPKTRVQIWEMEDAGDELRVKNQILGSK